MRGNILKSILVCLTALGVLVLFLGWWVSKNSPEWGKYILSFGGIFSAGVVGLFWLKENEAIKILQLLFSSFLILVIVNQCLLYLDRSKNYKSAQAMGIDFDKRDVLEFTRDLRKKGEEVYLYPSPLVFLNHTWDKIDLSSFFPLGGKSKATTVFCNESGTWITYKSDRFGFNNHNSVYDLENPAVVITGDSWAHGVCVPQENNIAGVLRKKGFKAISLGMPGQGPLTQLAGLIEYGRFFKPKVVIWLYNIRTSFLNGEKKAPILLKYLSSNFSQNLIEKQESLDSFLYEFNKKRIFKGTLNKYKNFLTFHIIRKHFKLSNSSFLKENNKYLNNDAVELQKKWMLLEQVYKKAKFITEEAGGKFYVVNLTSHTDYKKKLSQKYDLIKKLMKKLQIPIIDMQKQFANYDNLPELYSLHRINKHYNKKGYKLIADLIDEKGWLEGLN
jgi:hypothetical protein